MRLDNTRCYFAWSTFLANLILESYIAKSAFFFKFIIEFILASFVARPCFVYSRIQKLHPYMSLSILADSDAADAQPHHRTCRFRHESGRSLRQNKFHGKFSWLRVNNIKSCIRQLRHEDDAYASSLNCVPRFKLNLVTCNQ